MSVETGELDAHAQRRGGDRLRAQIVARKAHRHRVDRLGERLRQRHLALVVALVVARRPAVPGDRRVRDRRLRREAVRHGGGIDIDLEGGARLPARLGRPVELALAIVAPAGHGAHGARVGPAVLHHHDGALRDVVVLAILPEARLQRLVGDVLDVRVHRRPDDQRVLPDAMLDGDPAHLVIGPVEEIVRRLLEAPVDDARRVQPRADDLPLGHQVGLHEVGQHLVGTRARRRQVDARGIFRRRLEEAGEHRRFGEVDVAHVLAEIVLRRGRHAERASAHVHPVEIHAEDLLLRQVGLQPDREEGLLDLALERALVREEDVLGELLGDGRAALDDAVRLRIGDHGAEEADEVDAVMLEEAPVLRGDDRLDQRVGQLVDRHGALVDDAPMADLVAVAVEEGHGIVVLGAPVPPGGVEGGQRQRQHQHRSGGAERHRLAGELEDELPRPAHPEAAEEDGDLLPRLAGFEQRRPEAGIDPGIEAQQKIGALPRAVFLAERILHERLSRLLPDAAT